MTPQTDGCLSSEKLASRHFRELGQGKEPGRLDLCPFGAWENGSKVLGTRFAGRGLLGTLTYHDRKMKHSGEYIRLGYHPSSNASARLVKK